MQITEALAWAGCDVTQFIRRAQWVHIRDNPYSTWRERLKLRLPGGYRREQRRLWQMINEGDRWRLEPGPQREAMEREYQSFLDYIKDPDLKRKLTPDYNLGCTRIPKSDKNYYEAVQLPNAHIVKGADRPHRARWRGDGRRHAGARSTCWSTPPASTRTPICAR